MKFTEYADLYSRAKSEGSIPAGLSLYDFYTGIVGLPTSPYRLIHHTSSEYRFILSVSEALYWEASRPYYKVYPAFQNIFLGLKLNIPFSTLPKDDKVASIRFSEYHLPSDENESLNAVLFSLYTNKTSNARFLNCVTQSYIKSKDKYAYRALSMCDCSSIEEYLQDCISNTNEVTIEKRSVKSTNISSQELVVQAARFVVGVLLLSKDESVITPEVLSKDRLKYQETKDPPLGREGCQTGSCGLVYRRTV
jgi:hypothetical protein